MRKGSAAPVPAAGGLVAAEPTVRAEVVRVMIWQPQPLAPARPLAAGRWPVPLSARHRTWLQLRRAPWHSPA